MGTETETKTWVKEQSEWHKKTPQDIPIFVYGRHVLETKMTRGMRTFLTSKGFRVRQIPKEFRRLGGTRDKPDRKKYDKFLDNTFKGRPVVDMHSSHGFVSGGLLAQKRGKNLTAIEIQPARETISREQEFRLLVFLRKITKRKFPRGRVPKKKTEFAKKTNEKNNPNTKIEKKGKQFRIRIQDPLKFKKESFRTIDVGKKGGLQLIIGRKKGKITTSTQAIRVSTKDFRKKGNKLIPTTTRGRLEGLSLKKKKNLKVKKYFK